MTALNECIQRLKDKRASHLVKAGKEMDVIAGKVVKELCDLFERALTNDEIQTEDDLAKAIVLKRQTMVCVIDNSGARLRLDLDRYDDGAFKELDDVMRGVFVEICAAHMQNKYPEYRIRRDGGDIVITDVPPPPMTILEWLRSLFKPRELI